MSTNKNGKYIFGIENCFIPVRIKEDSRKKFGKYNKYCLFCNTIYNVVPIKRNKYKIVKKILDFSDKY